MLNRMLKNFTDYKYFLISFIIIMFITFATSLISINRNYIEYEKAKNFQSQYDIYYNGKLQKKNDIDISNLNVNNFIFKVDFDNKNIYIENNKR